MTRSGRQDVLAPVDHAVLAPDPVRRLSKWLAGSGVPGVEGAGHAPPARTFAISRQGKM